MKIEKVSDLTVKLILNNEDFEKRSLNANTLRIDSPNYQRLLYDILEHARIELGVHISTGRIKVEPVRSEVGSYEVTVTMIEPQHIFTGTANGATGAAGAIMGDNAHIEAIHSDQGKNTESRPNARDDSSAPIAVARTLAIPQSLLSYLIKNGLLPVPGILSQGAQPVSMPAGISYPDMGGFNDDDDDSSPLTLHSLPSDRIDNIIADGAAVISFTNYNTMFEFFNANRSFRVLPSKLYLLNDTFYLYVSVAKSRRSMFIRLDTKLADYDAMLLPVDIIKPFLNEYATVVFKNTAIKRVIESLQPIEFK